MAAFEYRQAEEIREAFARHGVRYLFLGKSAAILLGYPDTTQDGLDGGLLFSSSAYNGNCSTRLRQKLESVALAMSSKSAIISPKLTRR